MTPEFWGAPYLNMKDLIGKAEDKKEVKDEGSDFEDEEEN